MCIGLTPTLFMQLLAFYELMLFSRYLLHSFRYKVRLSEPFLINEIYVIHTFLSFIGECSYLVHNANFISLIINTVRLPMSMFPEASGDLHRFDGTKNRLVR